MNFLMTLPIQDLHRMRQVVKTVHMKHYPDEFMTNHEADKIIEAFGPETMENHLRIAVNWGMFK